MQKKQIDENMIFLLSTLSTSDYATLLEIFQKYEAGRLMKLPKSSSSGLCKPDCKGSHFRGLRNLDVAVTSQMLVKVRDGTLPLSQLNKACQEAKKLRDLKKKFVELVGLSTWTEAKAKYPNFATEEKLRDNCISLADYCQRVLRYHIVFVAQKFCESVQKSGNFLLFGLWPC